MEQADWKGGGFWPSADVNRSYKDTKQGQTFDQVAASAKLTKRRLLQIMDLAFLTPNIVKAIIIGDQPVGLTSDWLKKNPMPRAGFLRAGYFRISDPEMFGTSDA